MKAARFQVAQVDKDEEGEAAQVGPLLLHCCRVIDCALRSFCVPHPLLIFIFPCTLIDVILKHFAPFQIFFPDSNYIVFCIMYYPCIAVVSVHNSSVRRKLHQKRGKMPNNRISLVMNSKINAD